MRILLRIVQIKKTFSLLIYVYDILLHLLNSIIYTIAYIDLVFLLFLNILFKIDVFVLRLFENIIVGIYTNWKRGNI